jgi:hypothetical protein
MDAACLELELPWVSVLPLPWPSVSDFSTCALPRLTALMVSRDCSYYFWRNKPAGMCCELVIRLVLLLCFSGSTMNCAFAVVQVCFFPLPTNMLFLVQYPSSFAELNYYFSQGTLLKTGIN